MEESSPQDSVSLIVSADSDRNEFGSSFLIHKEKNFTYWLTCAHVLGGVGGVGKARIDENYPVQLVGHDEKDLGKLIKGYDLAVLRVEGEELLRKRPLRLKFFSNTELNRASRYFKFWSFGHYQDSGTRQKYIGEIFGQSKLSPSRLVSGGSRHKVLELELLSSQLLPGYSGSPVLFENSYDVVGIICKSKENGQKGEAAYIESIRHVLFNNLPTLYKRLTMRPCIKAGELTDSLSDKFLRLFVSSKVCEALDWLGNPQPLLDVVIQSVFGKQYVAESSSIEDKDVLLQRSIVMEEFEKELKYYIEMIYISILSGKVSDLSEVSSSLPPSPPLNTYLAALDCIKDNIPPQISDEISFLVRKHIDYLIEKLRSG
ncbi:serine protease [Leptolyngbya sp. CCY15150]|uniref:S1 family peptidase n=1 Tax=Leptolyngbya sp. CCY15150 TaxID=2767772 RepID=UPI00194F5D27|nr:serine protease [Leptolyngbya sp. CCY15150]